jgi:hypothetical protein
MPVKKAYKVSNYHITSPRKSNDMYTPPAGYQVANEVSTQLGRIAQKILSRAVDENWQMPSEIPLYFEGRKYIARYQIHGSNSQNPKKHPGIGLYELVANETRRVSYNSGTSNKLSSNFYIKLNEMCDRLGINPKDMLAVMYLESALDPSIIGHDKNGKEYSARGLTQLLPSSLKNVGWTGTSNEFGKLSGEEQLPYIERYFQNIKHTGKFNSATQLYIGNFWPVALSDPAVMRGDPNAVIVDSAKYPREYKDNEGLDLDNDGKITYSDIAKIVGGKKKALNNNGVYAKFDQSINGIPTQDNEQEGAGGMLSAFFKKIEHMIDGLIGNAQSEASISKYGIQYPNTAYIISIDSDGDFSSKLEFARIFSLAAKEEIDANSEIYTDGNNVEIKCVVAAKEKIGLEVIKEFILAISNVFENATKSIGGIKIYSFVVANENPSYQILGIRLSDINYRKFHLKFIKGSNV